MFTFPTSPVEPRVFVEEMIPALFAELVLEETERAIELSVGVVLQADVSTEVGEPGGEWTLKFSAGELKVTVGRAVDCDLTIVQRVVDWRSALWEGRPRLIADAVTKLTTSGPEALPRMPIEVEGGRANPLRGLAELTGLIEAVISDERDDGADWRVGVFLGPGPIPDAAQATIRLGTKEAEAIRLGEVHPVEALITGQLRLEGDLGLILQLQAIAMMAGAQPAPGSTGN